MGESIMYKGRTYTADFYGYFYNSHTRTYLHREVYRDEHGEIPEDHHIHHIDGDPSNNEPENLEALTPLEHTKRHRGSHPGDFPDEAREAAAEWHGSEEGRVWHSEHAKRMWKTMDVKISECETCGDDFEHYTAARFCSGACKSKYRRETGVDDEVRECEWCGGEFTVNKYRDTRFCSKSCSAKAQHHA